MSLIASPFLTQIKECKASMRKLRKKISKKCGSKQKHLKKKDSSQEIMEIFRLRKIPDFVTEALKKRRNFDLNSVKNIVINSPLPLEEIRNRVNLQEKQIDELFIVHRQRMEDERKKVSDDRKTKLALYHFSQSNIYSSTNQDDESFLGESEEYEDISISAEKEESVFSNYFQNLEEQSKEPIFTDNYLHMNESSVNSQLDLFNF